MDLYDYILVGTQVLSSPFYLIGRNFLDRGQALDFTSEVFDLSRRLRLEHSKSCESACRMLYDEAVSLNMDRGWSGVLTTYRSGHFASGQYDAWSAWYCNRLLSAQNVQAVTGATTDLTSTLYARWQERHRTHKTQSHDFDVLALVQIWKIKNCFHAWHLLPHEQRYAIIYRALGP
jgi:hypothetical protein